MKKIIKEVPVSKKIKSGDRVEVLLGKDRGQKGTVRKVYRAQGKVLVEGINKVKKHVKPQGKGKPGGIIEIERPIYVSKVALVCPSCKKPTRVGFQLDNQGRKQRICKKCHGLVGGGGKK